MNARALLAVLLVLLSTLRAYSASVEFNAPYQPVPYMESGLTFSTLPGTNTAVIGTGELISGTNNIPIHIRATADRAFTLTSLEISQFYRAWRIESSSGAVLPVTAVGLIDFSSLSGWSNISYFDIVHNPAMANGSIRVNRVEFQANTNSLIGDFSNNGVVDAADYVTWRSKIQTPAGYAAWRSKFGAGSGGSGQIAIPEPTTLAIVWIAIAYIALRRRPL